MMMKLFLPLLLVFASATANYDVIPRRSPSVDTGKRSLQSESPPVIVSFDGDLDAILSLALQAAQQEVDDAFACEGYGTVQHLEVVSWRYSIETTRSAVIPTVYGEVQEITLESTAPTTLACRNPMTSYANIVAMDTAIPSATETTSTCEPTIANAECTVVEGRMRLFLSETESVDDATAVLLNNIQTAYVDESFVTRVDTGLLKITYLGDGQSDSSENPITGNQPGAADNGELGTLGAPLSLLFVAVGSAAMIVFVGSIYLWRRGRRNEDDEGVVTQMAGTTAMDGTTGRPRSPYSEMVASSFAGLGENMSILSNGNMSPVYEQEHEDSSINTASVNPSECGYATTTTGGTIGGGASSGDSISQYSKFSACTSNTPKFLGARPLPDAVEMALGDVSDSDLSGEDLSPVKMFASRKTSTLLLPSGAEEEDENRADESLLFSPSSSEPELNSNMDDVPL